MLVILTMLAASSMFAAFIKSKPQGRQTALGRIKSYRHDYRLMIYLMFVARINVISTHINSISCSILFTIWLVRMILDEGLPYPVVVLAHYWQR